MTGREIGAIAAIMFAIWFIVEPDQPNEKQTANLDNVRVMKSVGGEMVVSNKGKVSPEEDYEMDLTERCKDWLYFRNRAYKLGKEGDTAGSAKASRTMQIFMRDLEKRFPEQVITEEIQRLEKEGFSSGF